MTKRKLKTFNRHPGQFKEHKHFCVGMPMCAWIDCAECMFGSRNKDEFHKWNGTKDVPGTKAGTTAVPEETPGGSCPSQYELPEGARELQDLIEAKNMNFSIGNIFKASYRMGNCQHSDAVRDLNKILWFAQRELDRLELMKNRPRWSEIWKDIKFNGVV